LLSLGSIGQWTECTADNVCLDNEIAKSKVSAVDRASAHVGPDADGTDVDLYVVLVNHGGDGPHRGCRPSIVQSDDPRTRSRGIVLRA